MRMGYIGDKCRIDIVVVCMSNEHKLHVIISNCASLSYKLNFCRACERDSKFSSIICEFSVGNFHR